LEPNQTKQLIAGGGPDRRSRQKPTQVDKNLLPDLNVHDEEVKAAPHLMHREKVWLLSLTKF
jgi:hypothetical protein